MQKAGVLIIGTEGTYRPFSYSEGGSGALVGYDVEIAQAVAAKLGVTAKFEQAEWDGLLAGLEAGRFTVVANQVSITPERQAKYLFSTPYTVSKGVVVVKADNNSISSFADIKGKSAAQSLTSNWYALAEKNGAQLQAVEGWAQAVALVRDGRVDATINDRLTFLDYQQQTGGNGLKVAATTDTSSQTAFAFKQGSDTLVKAVDGALAELQADGTIAKISQKYFGTDVSK